MNYKIQKATTEDVDQVGQIFDLYRQFYKYEPNIKVSTQYINDRIKNDESVIFIAKDSDNILVGFVQLYETFGSLDLGKIIVLYDLYVKKNNRKKGIAKNLILKAHEYAKKIGAKRIQLSTATDNLIAQSLYDSLGYVKDIEFYTYDFEIK